MKVTVDNIIDKISEYGLQMFNDYATEDRGHCFIVEDMIIFLDEDNDSLSVTFQADCKPEISANKILMLTEIENLSDITVMDSFIYDKNNNFLTGIKAHNLIKNSISIKAVKQLAREHAYNSILENAEGFRC